MIRINSSGRRILAAAVCLVASSAALQAPAQDAPIVQPGAPGSAVRVLSADEAIEIADTSYSAADVRFMQAMIPHHQQALEMSALAGDRTNTPELIDAAGRIEASQQDEIEFMRTWLRERGELDTDASADHSAHGPAEGEATGNVMDAMHGMATPEQMAALAASEGAGFDRLFLELMIRHHEGAVTMVEELLDQPGAAYDPALFEFTNDVTNDQTSEIDRMSALLAGLSSDPRTGLAAGFDDAGEAIAGLRLAARLGRPAGFFDPQNPAGLPPEMPADDEDDAGAEGTRDEAIIDGERAGAEGTARSEPGAGDAEDPVADADTPTEDDEEEAEDDYDRSPLLSFANTDIAFAGDVMVAGSYHGFNVYRLGGDGVPKLLSSVVCPGGQGDVSIVGELLIMSVEQTRGRLDCGLEGVASDISDDRFRGIRIFDISDLARPVQVGAVQTCRGSHTHSVVSADERRIVVYNSGTASVRDEEELPGCVGAIPGDDRTALFRIDVIEIPVDDPAAAKIIDSPAVFADPESGVLAGLWRGGDHGDDTQDTDRTDQCHDITVFPSAGLAAGACSGNGILFDISDPLEPTRLDAVIDSGFAYWHSATFNNDGTKVLFTDEWGGGSRPRCRSHDPLTWGADAIYDIVDGKLEFRGYFKMSAPQTDKENCVAHNGSIVPVPGRDIFVQSWYQGGISVIDFTDSANPVEIAYFDRGPIDEDHIILGGFWSSYWYRGRIYATEIVRGIDVLELIPSDYLTASEIEAARLADQGDVFNPQQQFPVTWPAEPVVAFAYLDQLERADALSASLQRELRSALNDAGRSLGDERRGRDLAGDLEALADDVERIGGSRADAGAAARQRMGLADTLNRLADRLR